ncbi:hypothetical protein EV182_001334 [Spiromyces aspiralis]|uniref:Uncharacterized protein n=1 Tax=Spiromyces aspiralis TaxID=68401 RepID=A0ACC1HHA2_9FUNG|nr:hypothetical protein EV182_001334 [Spiromyces aspiralis]
MFAVLATTAVLGGGYWYYKNSSRAAGRSLADDEVKAAKASATGNIRKALDPSKFIDFKLKEVKPLTHDTSLFRFELEPDQRLGLDVASCVLTRTPQENGKPVIRPYTPTSHESTVSFFDLVIKRGKASSHIHSLKPGDTLAIKGPIPKFTYKQNFKQEIGMIGGGSGITPMLQLIRAVLENPEDKTKLSLLFANRSEDDVILKDELDELAARHPDRFQVHYTIDKAKRQEWKGDVGFVTTEMIKKYMPDSSKGEDVLVCVCGPPGMMNLLSGPKAPDYSQGELTGLLKQLGYTEKNVFKY